MNRIDLPEPGTLSRDEVLMLALCRGDKRAFDLLYVYYFPRVVALVHKYPLNEANAEDVAESTFLNVYLQKDSFDPARGPFCAWLYGIARHERVNFLRKHREEIGAVAADGKSLFDQLVSRGLGPEQAAVLQEFVAQLRDCLGKLPPDRLTSFYLAHFEDVNRTELAEQLGISYEALAGRLHRDLQAMVNCLHDKGYRDFTDLKPILKLAREYLGLVNQASPAGNTQ